MRTLSLLLSLLFTIIIILNPDPETYGLSRTSPIFTRITYQFLHGGIAHLLLNIYSLLVLSYLCPTKVWHLLIAMSIAFIIPDFMLPEGIPVVGFSAAIYAIAGMSIMYNNKWWWLVIINLMFMASTLAFTPIAVAVHAYAFFFGLSIGFMCGTRYNV